MLVVQLTEFEGFKVGQLVACKSEIYSRFMRVLRIEMDHLTTDADKVAYPLAKVGDVRGPYLICTDACSEEGHPIKNDTVREFNPNGLLKADDKIRDLIQKTEEKLKHLNNLLNNEGAK